MAYRYRKFQLFNKKLDVPKGIQNQIYNNSLSLEDYIYYDLDGKIPTTCLVEKHRVILELYGIEKLRTIDLQLFYRNMIPAFRQVYDHLLMADPIPDNVNTYLYEIFGKIVSPDQYTDGMKEFYPDRSFSDEEMKDSPYYSEMVSFNYGSLSVSQVIKCWDVFKYKDLDYILRSDSEAVKMGLTSDKIRKFMVEYGALLDLIGYNVSVYNLIGNMMDENKSKEDKDSYIKSIIENIINEAKMYGREITNEEFKVIFNFISIKDYLESTSSFYIEDILKEIDQVGMDYFYSAHIPLSVLFSYKVMNFTRIYSMKNIIEFDLNCGGLFSKNNYSLLYNMYDLYMHYAGNDHNPKTTFLTRKSVDENGRYVERPYTKYEFFEAFKRMLLKGPSDAYLVDMCPNFKDVTGEFRDVFPQLFLSDEAPKELQDLFYSKGLLTTHLHDHPEWIQYLNGKDFEVAFKRKEVKNGYGNYPHLLNYLSDKYGFEEAMEFAKEYYELIELAFSTNVIHDGYRFNFEDDFSKIESLDDIKKLFNKLMIICVEKLNCKIPRDVPEFTKIMYPNLFLGEDVPEDIQDKYYNREFDYEFIKSHPDILKYFGNTNIGYGFNKEFKWLTDFNVGKGLQESNEKRLEILEYYGKINDVSLQECFIEFVKENPNTADNLELVSDLLTRLSYSNSGEIFTFRKEIAKQLLEVENPIESLGRIEKIFIKNNLPTFMKLYEVFNILHPGCVGFDFGASSSVSPVLKSVSVSERERIIFGDLLKSSLLSNNRSFNEFINIVEIGSVIADSQSLSDEEVIVATRFRDILISLYERKGVGFKATDDVLSDIQLLKSELCIDDKSLGDSIVTMLASGIGLDSLEALKGYVEKKLEETEQRNVEFAKQFTREGGMTGLRLETGDFIKGIGSVDYLKTILQNGSVSKEYLGVSATSDGTPLDTDLSKFTTSSYNLRDMIESTAANGYGDILFVLKNREGRFNYTRPHETRVETSTIDDRLEVFYTGICDTKTSSHYGIRTGFASSEIDCIILKNYDKRVFLEIAMNGFYIPVVDFDNNLIFSYSDYLEMRAKMGGLTHYGCDEFYFSDQLEIPDALDIVEQLEKSEFDTKYKRDKVLGAIKEALDEMGLKLKTSIDFDLTEGSVELIDTGSTGRGTNKPGDGDFDFMMRVDRVLLESPERLEELRRRLLSKLVSNQPTVIATGDFRLKGVVLDDVIVDVDITFTEKSDKVKYSTDMALCDRLDTIKKQDPDKYRLVVANILLAKQVLKEAGCYKPNRGEVPQGGLGGVGIENWILQHGGSFMAAIDDFLHYANGMEFNEFVTKYVVNDFGENHLAARRGNYVHDNFVNNMSAEGYAKMVEALNAYQYTVKYGNDKTSLLS